MVNHTIRKLDYGLCVGKSKRIRMKNLNDQFSDEEKEHLSYLGSMLGRPNTPEEQEIEDILDALEKASRTNAGGINQTPREGGAD